MIVFTTIVAYLFARYDADILNNGKFIDSHNSRFAIRGLTILTMAIILGLIDGNTITLFFGGGLIFASLFDMFLNEMRCLPVFHLGNTAKWDKFWRKRILLYILSKVIAFSLGVWLCW